ncbi:anti-sigma factor family protein [Aestuariispira insulae]|uniref:Transcriptional regulator n=1 Tax=Aestuariispira insulae TaxID=1461337 RepID=A0A3D9HE71_9PROT|nr:anti-sigma factor [Aestuariispira insulae]RED47755.1 transcriptional regulator [Aestuariispira insulae]
MSRQDPIFSDDEMMMYVDGQLDPDRVGAMEAFLKENPDAMEKVRTWQQQNQDLKALFDREVDAPVPDYLDPRNLRKNRESRMSLWRPELRLVAASILLLAVGLAGGWMTRGILASQDFSASAEAHLAINAHDVYSVDKTHPVEVTAEQSQHLVSWLSKRLDRQLIEPDLSGLDFDLIGGRLLAATNGAAAQFMFEDEKGERVTLFITPNPSGKTSSFAFVSQGKTGAFYWLNPSLSFNLVGNLSKDQLEGLASKLQAQWPAGAI